MPAGGSSVLIIKIDAMKSHFIDNRSCRRTQLKRRTGSHPADGIAPRSRTGLDTVSPPYRHEALHRRDQSNRTSNSPRTRSRPPSSTANSSQAHKSDHVAGANGTALTSESTPASLMAIAASKLTPDGKSASMHRTGDNYH